MPNVSLIKDDGLPLILPGSSIIAVVSTNRAPNKDHPDARSVVMSNFRQISVYFLAQPAKEVLDEIKKDDAKKAARNWIELPCDGDIAAILKSDLLSAEGVDLAKEKRDAHQAKVDRGDDVSNDPEPPAEDEKDIALRVWSRRPDGREMFTDVDMTPEILTSVLKALDQQPVAKAPARPAGPAGAPVMMAP